MKRNALHRLVPLASLSVLMACTAPPEPAESQAALVTTAPLDGCPFTDQVMCDVYNAGSKASEVIGVVSSMQGWISTATNLLQEMGIIATAPSEVSQMEHDLEVLAGQLGTQIININVDRAVALLFGDVTAAGQVLQSSQTVPIGSQINSDSLGQTRDLATNIGYRYRLNIDALTNGDWKTFLLARPPVTSLGVYDWRVILPALLQGIAGRETIIAAITSGFYGDPRFSPELLGYAGALAYHRDQILGSGIQCTYGLDGTPNWVWWFPSMTPITYNIVCADIFSGTFVRRDVNNPSSPTPMPQNVIDSQTNMARADLYQKLPLFDVQASIDALTLAATNAPDLASGSDGSVRLASSPGLCLDSAGGRTAIWTPLALSSCNHASSQRWRYDRANRQLVQVATGLCARANGETPGASVILDGCGRPGAGFTYSPLVDAAGDDRGMLANDFGYVLDAGGSPAVGTPVQIWPHNGSAAQRWTAFGPWQALDLTATTGALAAAQGSALASYVWNVSEHIMYVGADHHVRELSYDPHYLGATWYSNDPTASAGALNAAAGSPLAAYALPSSEMVVYVGADRHVHHLAFASGSPWVDTDITIHSFGPALASGTPLTAYLWGQSEHVIHVGADGDLHELWFDPAKSTSWYNVDLTANAGAPAPYAGGALAGWVWGNSEHVAYQGVDGHLHELWFDPSKGTHWFHVDLTMNAGVAAPPFSPRSLTAYVWGNAEHVLYVDANFHVQELWFDPSKGASWFHDDLTLSAAAPQAQLFSALSSWSFGPNEHVTYLDRSGHVQELFYGATGSSWLDADWTVDSGSPAAQAFGPLTSYATPSSEHLAYLDGAGHVQTLWWGVAP